MASSHAVGTLSPFRVALQIGLVCAAFSFWDSSVLQPIKLMVVLLHEMSHGLMALATGGSVEDIVITPNEGGACETAGGNVFLIVSSGYLGSMFFGGLILSASRSRARSTMVYALIAFLLFAASFTVVQDGYSRRFALSVAAAAILVGAFAPGFITCFILRAVGTVSSLYAIVDIYNDILSRTAQTGRVQSDAAALAEITGISAVAIGLGWLLLSLGYFVLVLKASLHDDDGPPKPAGKGSPAVASA